jgi:formyltetrahydrofolate-dependent phosphoribosylglycinamide formyltransferase
MDRRDQARRFAAPVRLGVLISGSGRTLQNLIDRIREGSLPARIEVVISSHAGVRGLERASQAGIPAHVVDYRAIRGDRGYADAVAETLMRYPVDLVVMAGFLRRFLFPASLRGRVLNIHPGLLPRFGGKGLWGHHVHEAVLKAGVAESGCTVHVADHEYDHGPVLLEKRVPVLAGDTPDTLAARVFEAECAAYPEAIRSLVDPAPVEGR